MGFLFLYFQETKHANICVTKFDNYIMLTFI